MPALPLAAVPKTETHLHIEGALPFALLQSLDASASTAPPPSWAVDFRFEDFAHFDRTLRALAVPWFTSPERYHLAAKQALERLYRQGVRYAEVSFASAVLEFGGLDGQAVAEALHAAAPRDMRLLVFLGIHHNGCPPKMERVLEAALGWRALDGIDLHGDETLPLEPWSADYWRAARRAGKHTKAHAGELCGPAFIWQVLRELGVRQIAHGVRAVEDAELVRHLARERIVLDICPTSNVKLRVAAGYREHPLRALRRAGVLCTVNSDDPLVFGHHLEDEYLVLEREMGCVPAEILDCIREGWRAAKIPESERRARLAEVDAAWSSG